jgi:hypothetical protein
MDNYQATIISQYSSALTLTQLIANYNTYLEPGPDLDNFYNYVWNITTTQGFGLDIWGKIVGVGRTLQVPAGAYLGFEEGNDNLDYRSFGFGTLFSINAATNTVILSDEAYRTLILVKAFSNISNLTARNVNKLLNILFAGRGLCYVSDDGGMQITYHFDFTLAPFEIAILQNSGAVPRPAGVAVIIDY